MSKICSTFAKIIGISYKHNMVGIVGLCKEQVNYEKWLTHYQIPFKTVENEQQAEGVKCMLFCGGPDWGVNLERDALDKRMFTYCYEHRIPMLGVCRGMQLVALFLGAQLIDDLGEKNEIHRAYLTAESRIKASRFHDIHLSDGRCMRVNSRHHQAVKNIPVECVLTARSKDGVYELMLSADEQVLLVQCHPERDEMRDSPLEQLCVNFLRKWCRV